MLGLFDALGRAVVRLGRFLRPRNLRRIAAWLPLYAPLAARSTRRRLLRYLLVGLSLGAGITVYLCLVASLNGQASGLARRTGEMELPAHVLVFGLAGPGSQPVESLKWVAPAGPYEPFDRWRATTSLGQRWVVGLEPGGRLWSDLGLESGSLPAGGEVLVAGDLAQAAGLGVGDVVVLAGAGSDERVILRVSGTLDDRTGRSALYEEALVVALPTSLEARARLGDRDPRVDALAVWERDPGDLDRLLGRLRELFPAASLWWAGLPAGQAYRTAGGFLSPGRVTCALVFVLAGLGVFNVMLLTLLQRKVQLGVLKALGAEDDEVFLLLLLEGALTALGGTALGLSAGLAAVAWLDKASAVTLALSPSSLLWAVILALASFFAAAWLPATLCRRATAVQLMAGRRLYLNPRSTCAQCGRCGGF